MHLNLQFSPSDLERIETAVPAEAVAGTRYREAHGHAWIVNVNG